MLSTHITQKKFSNGAHVLMRRIEAHGLVSIVGSFRGGSLLSKNEELSDVHAQMLMEGTHSHSKRDIQLALDAIGASLQFSSSKDRLIFSARVRAIHAAKLLALISEIVREPLFGAHELRALKKREQAALKLQAEDTNTQAKIYLTRLLYKKDHTNYSETTAECEKELSRITPASLEKYHKKILNASTFVIAVAGDMLPAKLFSLVGKEFGILPKGSHKGAKHTTARVSPARKKFVTIKNKASIDLMLGVTTGITANHKDYPALLLGINILGIPGFTGRLMQHVREKEGLTYGTSASLSGFDYQTDGHLLLWGTFAPQLLERGRDSILRQVGLIVEDGATETEVMKHARMYEANRRVRLSNSMAFASALHMIGVEKRNPSYLDEFPKKILALTTSKVNRALKKYLVPKKLSESAAGSKGE